MKAARYRRIMGGWDRRWAGLAAAAALLCCGFANASRADTPEPAALADQPTNVPVASSQALYVVRFDHWSEADERGFGEFVAAIGNSLCRTVDSCLHDPANPFRASDPD